GAASDELPVEREVRLGCRVPRQSFAGAPGACTGSVERSGVVEQLCDRMCERLYVVSGDDAAGAEGSNRLGEPAHVVDDDRDPRAERLKERTRLVELGAVGKDRDRGVPESQ